MSETEAVGSRFWILRVAKLSKRFRRFSGGPGDSCGGRGFCTVNGTCQCDVRRPMLQVKTCYKQFSQLRIWKLWMFSRLNTSFWSTVQGSRHFMCWYHVLSTRRDELLGHQDGERMDEKLISQRACRPHLNCCLIGTNDSKVHTATT